MTLGEWLELAALDGRGLETYFGHASNGSRGSASMTIGRGAYRLERIELGDRVCDWSAWIHI